MSLLSSSSPRCRAVSSFVSLLVGTVMEDGVACEAAEDREEEDREEAEEDREEEEEVVVVEGDLLFLDF